MFGTVKRLLMELHPLRQFSCWIGSERHSLFLFKFFSLFQGEVLKIITEQAAEILLNN